MGDDFNLAALAALLGALCYANSLGGALVWDDRMAIVGNADVTNLDSPLAALLRHDFWGQPIASDHSHKSYRPLCVLSFRANFALHGLAPLGYHAVNVAAHALTCALVVLLARRLHLRRAAAALGGLIFAAHPIHTEAVAGVVGRADVLATAGFALALLLYLDAIHVVAAPPPGEARCHRRCGACVGVVAALGCAVAATLVKELGFTTLPVLIALDVLEGGWRAPSAARALRVALIATFAGAMLALRLRAHGGHALRPWTVLENNAVLAPTSTQRALSIAHLHARYAAALVCPVQLSYDWGFDAIPVITGLLDPRNVLTAAAYVGTFVALGVAVVMRDGAVLRCAICALLPFAPMSNLLFPVGTMVGERLLYMPSVGFCLALGHVLARAGGLDGGGEVNGNAHANDNAQALLLPPPPPPPPSSRRRRAWAHALLGAFLAAGVARTVQRNAEWRTELALFESAFRVAPASVKVRNNLAQVLLQDGSVDSAHRALALLQGAVAIHPNYSAAEINLGLAQRTLGDAAKAAEHFKRAGEFFMIAYD